MIGLYILGGLNFIGLVVLGVYVYISSKPSTAATQLTATSSDSPFIIPEKEGCGVDFPDPAKMTEVKSLAEQDRIFWRREQLNG